MKRLCASLLALCLAFPGYAQVPMTGAGLGAPGGGGGGISVKQQVFAADTGSFATSITATFGSGTSAGSIIVCLGWAQSVASALTFADNNSDTPTDSGLGSFMDSGGQFYSAITAFFTPTTGTTSVTMNFGNTNPYALQCYEVAGISGASWDTKNATSSTGVSQTSSTGTLAQAAEFIITMGAGTNNCATSMSLTAVPGTFVFDNEHDHSCTGGTNLQTGHMITSATSSVTSTILAAFATLMSAIASVK